ncbi:MAG: biotin/lipoyl-containing protein [Vicinamibacterales bacterium]|jgi:biotin carboxyl carrier protein
MTFEVAAGNGVRSVTISRKGALLHVVIGDRTHVVDARRVGELALSLLVQPQDASQPTRSVDVALAAQRTAGDFDVHVAGRTIPVQVRVAGGFGRQKKAGAAHGTGPQRIVAPMPGKIVRVLVKAGDQVTARQGLVVVEAMKMENELRAVRDGRVREVSVVEGQSVDAGASLLVVE